MQSSIELRFEMQGSFLSFSLPPSLPPFLSPQGVARSVLELGTVKDLPQGLSKISAVVLGQPLAKAERLSDWERRPLTPEQVQCYCYFFSIYNICAYHHQSE